VAQTDFRAEAGREGCGRVLVRAAFPLLEEMTAGNTRFVEAQVAESTANLRIEVRLQNGRSLMVGRGFGPEHVRELTVFTKDGVVPSTTM
jgi:hypothetical protein